MRSVSYGIARLYTLLWPSHVEATCAQSQLLRPFLRLVLCVGAHVSEVWK